MFIFKRPLAAGLALALLGCGSEGTSNGAVGGSPSASGGGGGASTGSMAGAGGLATTPPSAGAAGAAPGSAGAANGGNGGASAGNGGVANGGAPNGGAANGGGGNASAGSSGSGGGATCQPADKTPAPTAVNVKATGAAFTGKHQIVVETDPGLKGVTIYRPKDLGGADKYPIVVWGQGGCSQNGTENPEFVSEIASHGYLVLADGTPNGAGNRPQTTDYKAMGQPLVQALNWAIKENGRACSQYYQNLATTKAAVMGWSCGGLMAEGASSDPRWTTAVLWSSGMITPDQKILDAMHAPSAIFLGGTGDIAYPNGTRDYQNIGNIPIFLGSTDVGHGGTYPQDNGGLFGKVAVGWLGWQLQGDMAATGKGMFVGASCGLCTDSKWTVQSKRLE